MLSIIENLTNSDPINAGREGCVGCFSQCHYCRGPSRHFTLNFVSFMTKNHARHVEAASINLSISSGWSTYPPPPASVPPPEIRFYKWLIYHWFPLIRPYWSLISGPFPISFSSSLSSLSEQSGDTGQSETSRLPSDINQQLLNDPLDLHSYKSLESTLANLLPIKKTSIISLFCKHESDESGAEAATLESRSLELRRRLGWCQLFGSPTLTLNEITTNN